MKSVALVELFPYHSECLYAQLLFLQGHARVILICDVRLKPIVKTFGAIMTIVYFLILENYRHCSNCVPI